MIRGQALLVLPATLLAIAAVATRAAPFIAAGSTKDDQTFLAGAELYNR